MKTVMTWAAIGAVTVLVTTLVTTQPASAAAARATQATAATPQPQTGAATTGRGAVPAKPLPATIRRARKELIDAIVEEAANKPVIDCDKTSAIGARIVSVERYDAATKIWPIHATVICTGPNTINEVPSTFNVTRNTKGRWKAAYVKNDAAS